MGRYIPVSEPDLSGNEKRYLIDCFNSGWISSKGVSIERFEKKFAEFIGTKYAVATSNGTTALHLALVALGIKKGDEVLVPDLTFIACANCVTYTGAKPIFVDVESTTWNIDSSKIEGKISNKTKAIMVVHLYGHPADMSRIIPIAQKKNLIIIEDVAEAHGAEIKIREKWIKVGSLGNVGCFSFYGNKIITTGEGGMVVTNDKNLYEKIKILRDHGQTPEKRYYHEVIGFNYRMTNLQAAIGLGQLERIKELIRKKRKIGKLYHQLLKDIPGITLSPEADWAKSVYWMYSILVEKPYPLSRDELIDELHKQNIETRPFFYPIHILPPYLEKNNYAQSEYLSKHGINLPSSSLLRQSDVNRICQIVRKYTS
jgi:perosamine synthetase